MWPRLSVQVDNLEPYRGGDAMGKRQRRRQRQQKTAKQQKPAVQRHLIPNVDAPLLEVVFHPDIADSDKGVCLDYWAFTEPGIWSRKVAEIGPTTQVLRTVKASCHADLLTLVCPDCASPLSVYSRSDVAATGPCVAVAPVYVPPATVR